MGRWDGRRWHALGEGLDERAFAVAVEGNRVYVGGQFTKAANKTVNGIAMWDGAQWTALGNSQTMGVAVDDRNKPEWVNTIAVDGNNVYIGGQFASVDGVRAQNLAMWDGARWSAVGGGTDAEVEVLLFHDGTLYVGGDFTQVGALNANGIATWDGAAWSPLGQGVESNFDGTTVYTIMVDDSVNDGDVYVGGYFQRAGGRVANSVARWDGAQWHSLDTGALIDDEFLGRVYSLSRNNGKIYAGGDFNSVGNVGAHNIAAWDGNEWNLLGGTDGPVFTVAARPGRGVYLGGNFEKSGGLYTYNIAQFNDPGWRAFGQGVANQTIAGTVHAAARDAQNQLFVGGFIRRVGGLPVSHIAMWDGETWSALGDGVNGRVRTIAVDGDNVYVGGDFSQAGGISAKSIAVWNKVEETWSPLGSGTNDDVHVLFVHNGWLYAGGKFTSAGTVSSMYVARWDGARWHRLGQQPYSFVCRSSIGSVTHGVRDIAVMGSRIFFAGQFIRMSFDETCINFTFW